MPRSSSTIAALRKQPRIRVDLPSDIAEHVRERAEAEGRSVGEMVLILVAGKLAEERETPRIIP